jgi:hypothetical protein
MSKNSLKSSILTDFISLTNSSEIRAANEFANIIRLMSNKACYLESLYQTSNANDYKTKKLFCKRLPKHRMFLSIYEEYLRKKDSGGEIREYEELFQNNKLSLGLLRLLVVVDPLLSFPFWFHTKIRKRIHRILSGKKKQVIFTCFKRGVHENILSANRGLQSKTYRHQIETIIDHLVQHTYPQ